MKVESKWSEWSRFLGGVFLLILMILLGLDFWQKGIFNQNLGLNLLVVGERSVGLMSLRPKEKTIQWLRFAPDLKVKIYNTSATYPLSSLWEFGKTEHNPYVVVEKSVGNMLGIAVAKTMRVNGEATPEQVLDGFLSLVTSTDLSLRDRIVMRGMISEAILSKKVIELEMPETAFTKIVEPDGKEFKTMNEVAMVWLKDKFYFESIMAENVEVKINNISGVVGLGNLMARQTESAGMKVLEVKNDETDGVSKQGCWYWVKKDEYKLTEEYLEKQLGCRRVDDVEKKNVEAKLIKIWLK